MALAIDAITVSTSDSLTLGPITLEHTVASGASLLLVGIAAAENTGASYAPSAVTWNGDAMTLVPDTDEAGAYNCSYFYSITNPDSGTYNVSVSITPQTGSGPNARIVAVSFLEGEVRGGAGLTGDTMTIDVTTESGDIVFDALVIYANDATTWTVGANQSEDINRLFNNYWRGASHETASGTTTTMSWTSDGTPYTSKHSVVAIKQAAAATKIPVFMHHYTQQGIS